MENYNIIAEQEHCTVMAHYEPLPREDNGYQSEAALEASFIKQQLAQRERQYEYYRNKLLTFE